jgi:hypothetical protein
MARFEVIPTPRGLWPFMVYDNERQTHVGCYNDKNRAKAEAQKRNELAFNA